MGLGAVFSGTTETQQKRVSGAAPFGTLLGSRLRSASVEISYCRASVSCHPSRLRCRRRGSKDLFAPAWGLFAAASGLSTHALSAPGSIAKR